MQKNLHGLFKYTLFLTVIAMLISILPGHVAEAQSPSFTFKPVADAYVNAGSSGSNYGTNVSLRMASTEQQAVAWIAAA